MLDLVYVLGGIVFFAGATRYVAFCDRVIGVAGDERDDAGGSRRDRP